MSPPRRQQMPVSQLPAGASRRSCALRGASSLLFVFVVAAAPGFPAAPARAQGVLGEVLGVTIEPGERGTRLTLRCSAPMRPTWRREGGKIVLELPGASTSTLPPELPVDANGIRSLRPR